MDLAGKMVKIRFKKYFSEQRLWTFVGKTIEITENWIQAEGKGIIIYHDTVQKSIIDEEIRTLVIPRDNIAHIRLLPDNFALDKLEIETRGARDFIKVANGPDTSINEL